MLSCNGTQHGPSGQFVHGESAGIAWGDGEAFLRFLGLEDGREGCLAFFEHEGLFGRAVAEGLEEPVLD